MGFEFILAKMQREHMNNINHGAIEMLKDNKYVFPDTDTDTYQQIVTGQIDTFSQSYINLKRKLHRIGITDFIAGNEDPHSFFLSANKHFKLTPSTLYSLCDYLETQNNVLNHEDSPNWTPYDNIANSLASAECFDFGIVDYTLLCQAMPKATAMYGQGILKLPFTFTCFDITLPSDGTKSHQLIIAEQLENTVLLRTFLYLDDLNIVILKHVFELKSDEYSEYQFRPIWTHKAYEKDLNESETFAIGVFSWALMVLNTKGAIKKSKVRRNYTAEKTTSPSKKTVTVINTSKYEQAQSMKRGSNKSPHLRRGHVRNYTSGKVVWVKDAVINCTESTKFHVREKYKVNPNTQ